MAAGTTWDAVPIRELKWQGTWPYQSLPQACLWSWLKLNFAGMLSVKLCDGSSRWWRMFSFVQEVAQVVLAATSQIHRRHMRTTLKSLPQRRIIANIFGKEVDLYWQEVCSTNSMFNYQNSIKIQQSFHLGHHALLSQRAQMSTEICIKLFIAAFFFL